MLTVSRLAQLALQYQRFPTALGALRDMNAAVAALESLGFPPESARQHPIAVLLADRAGLMLRCELLDDIKATETYAQVYELAHKD